MKNIILIIVCLLATGHLHAQYKVDNSKSTMTVSGTSSMHDWESNVETISGTAELVLEDGQVIEVNTLTLSVPVNSIKSSKSGMDSKTYEALKEKTSPNILYNLTSASVNSNGFSTTGNLTIAGKSKLAKMDVTSTVNTDGSVTFAGSIGVKMSEYDMKPPTAMLGAIKTGDDITIKYSVSFKK